MIPEAIRPYCFLNPFAGILTLYHTVLYDGLWPPIPMLISVFGSAIAICFIGYAFFNRFKNACVEIA